MKNEAADLGRIGLNLILKNICARSWKFFYDKQYNELKKVQAYVCV
jgi:hypothetical protein